MKNEEKKHASQKLETQEKKRVDLLQISGNDPPQEVTISDPVKFYKKRWVRITAATVAFVMLFTTVYVAYGNSVSIQAASPEEEKQYVSKEDLDAYITLVKQMEQQKEQEALIKAEEERLTAIYEEALAKEEQQDYQAAADLYTSLIESDAYDPVFYICRAKCSFYQGDYERLINDCNLYFSDGGTDEDGSIHYLMAVSQMYLERFEDAKTSLDYCISAGDAIEELHFYRGVCSMATGLYKDAADDFSISIERGELTEESQENQQLCLELQNIETQQL